MSKQYKFHYVYRITNLVTRRYYYGIHSCNCLPKEDIGVKYFSSSKSNRFGGGPLWIMEQKSNPSNYKYKIVSQFPTRLLALAREIRLHRMYDVAKNPVFYNASKQTSTGYDTSGVPISQAAKDKAEATRATNLVSGKIRKTRVASQEKGKPKSQGTISKHKETREANKAINPHYVNP